MDSAPIRKIDFKDTTPLSKVVEAKNEKIPAALKNVANARAKVEALKIENDADYERAGQWLVMAKDRKRVIENLRDEIVSPLFKIYKAAGAEFSPVLTAYQDEVIRPLDRKMGDYLKERERKKLALEAEARQKAKEDEDRRKRELEEQAKAAEVEGDAELASEIRNHASMPVPVPRPIMSTKPPKLEKLSPRKSWKARIPDKEAFIAAVLAGRVPLEYVTIEPNMTVINGIGKATDGKAKIEGVVFEEDIIHAGRG